MSTPSTPAVPSIDAEGASSKAAASFKKVREEGDETKRRERVRGWGRWRQAVASLPRRPGHTQPPRLAPRDAHCARQSLLEVSEGVGSGS